MVRYTCLLKLAILVCLPTLIVAAEQDQPQVGDVAPHQDAVVQVVQGLNIGIDALQNLFQAEFVEGAEPDAFGALADGFSDAAQHFAGGFIRKGEAENIFAGEFGVGFKEVADALGDYARFAGASAGDHQERAFSVLDGGALCGVEREAWGRGFLRICGPGH